MKKLIFLVVLLTGCVQTDLEDPFTPTLRIDNSVDEVDFRVNGVYPLMAVYTDDTGEATDIPLTWESSDNSILSFEDNTATVHEEGQVLIRVSTNGLEASTLIETLPSRGSLQISGFTPKLQSGNSTPFKFNFIDIQGSTDNSIEATWTSSDESIATINQNGLVTALSAGITDISVTFDGVSNATKLEVSNDPVMVDPVIRIVEFAQFLSGGKSFTFQSDFYNESGVLDEAATINWSSSDEAVLSINENGVASAMSSGTANIEASYDGISTSVSVLVEGDEPTERTGTLMGTGYDIEGAFTLSQNEAGDLILTIEGYKPDGPGPYFYLTNQNNNVNNGINLGEAKTPGDITINVSEVDPSVEVSSFNFLMIWCEPFRVRLGVGEFDN